MRGEGLVFKSTFIDSVGNSQTEILRKNEHLVVAGNDSDGMAKVWITSKLFASTITVPLDPNVSISSVYNEQSLTSRNRELLVESSYISNTTSQHHIFVPLENAVLVATFAYNGSSNTGTAYPVSQLCVSSLCPSMSRCASLGVYRIGGALYTVCAGSSGICICGLTSDDADGQISYSSSNCRLLNQPLSRNDVINVHGISNIVIYRPHQFLGHLMFALNNYVYQTSPAHSTDSHIYIEPGFCLAITRLQIVASKLLIFCTNNSYVLEYDIDVAEFLSPQFNNHLYFPCSENMDFSVNLTNTEIIYRTNNVPSQQSGLRIGRFKFGECITHRNHHFFLYINTQNNSLHIVNSSMLTPYNLTEGSPIGMCANNEYDRPVFIGERYIIAYDLGCQITSVFDLQDITSAIITQKSRPLLLATVISNISAIITTASAPPPEEFIIAPPIIVVGVIVLFIYSMFNIIVLIMIWKR